jgi:putative hemolysin
MPWLNVVLLAPTLILFGDVLPKTLGLRFARQVVHWVIRPLAFWNELVSPVRFVLLGVVDLILRGLGVSPVPVHDTLQEQQLRTLIDQGRETGVIQPMEQEIIHRVFEFGDLPVSRLMTPRPDIFSLSVTTPWPELLSEIRTARYSRVPIWQGNPDNIVGILLVKDLLRVHGAQPPHARQLQKMLHPAMFVPPSKRAQDLLREFRARNNHMAVVVDEHGSIAGLITLDDLLSELVGEVLDESDVDEKEAVRVQENIWTVRAGIDIEDFGQRFGVDLPEGDYTTLGGFVFHQLGAAPQKGDEVEWDGLRFHVAGVDGRRITEVTVTFRADGVPAADEEP